jgi:uncharacterized protein YbaR (Trm112 family)
VFVELIESLRCPRDHEESPLIVTASRTEARHILEGILGCPICHAEFPIRGGEAFFGTEVTTEAIAPNPEMAMRLAAFLDLTDARSFAILCGSWGAHAEEVRTITDTPLLLVNPPAGVDVSATGIVRTRGRLPVASLAARAAALDDGGDALLAASTVAAVRPNGRVVGPVTRPMPDGVRELTRDAQMWVGEKSAASEDPTRRLVPLRRA